MRTLILLISSSPANSAVGVHSIRASFARSQTPSSSTSAISATVAEETGAKVARLGAPRIPVGYAPTLEAEARVSAAQVAAAAQKLAA